MAMGILEGLGLEGNFMGFRRSIAVGVIMRQRAAGSGDVKAVEDHKISNPPVPTSEAIYASPFHFIRVRGEWTPAVLSQSHVLPFSGFTPS